ncbi:sex peptide receptor-like [Planococcus citri]|uniref:sex peptide receptor-like n=1 Tax=Planococcus citri TaxID=170843 RepID=UPI0031F77254
MNPENAPWIKDYHSYYNMRICGYVDMVCCLVATISNFLIIMVFTRNTTVSPTNTIFIHIAITESLAILSFLPRSWHEYYRVERCSIDIHRTYGWENLALNSYMIAFAFRHVVVWLTVMLGVWRYIAVVHPLKKRQWCDDMGVTQRWIIGAYIFGFLITIPPYTNSAVQPSIILLDEEMCLASISTAGNSTKNVTIYEFKVTVESTPTYYSFLMISYGILIKSLPAIVLTVICFKLICALIKARKHRAVMVASLNQKLMEKRTDRTTIILLLILALFIATEIPHGICATITGFLGPKFYWGYYYYIMEVANTFVHISSSFNFVFYYTMSNQFRTTFKALFKSNGDTRRSSRDGHYMNSVSQLGINKIEHVGI